MDDWWPEGFSNLARTVGERGLGQPRGGYQLHERTQTRSDSLSAATSRIHLVSYRNRDPLRECGEKLSGMML